METNIITMLITLVATSGVFTLFLCLYAYVKRKEIPGARTFIWYTASMTIYIFAVAFEWTSDTVDEIMRWTVVEYLGIAFAPPLGLLLVLQYIGKSVPRKVAALMFVVPAVTFLSVATNDWHHLFYKSIFLRENAPSPLADVAIGEMYIVHGAYTFGCMLASVVLLVRQWFRTNRAFRLQLATLTIGQFLPMVGAFLYLMGVTPYGMDPVPMVLCLTSGMYIWAMVSSRVLTIVPIAKERLFESLREGVIVLDATERIVDFNASVARMMPGLTASSIGTFLRDEWPRLTGSPLPVGGTGGGIGDGMQEVMVWTVKGEDVSYQVRSSLVRDRTGETIGRLLMLIDVTEQKRLQDKLTQMAYFDGLTKLLNRARFVQRSRELLSSAQRFGLPVSFVLFDIDSFKRINDTYGHDVGDQAIVHVVSIAKRLLPPDALFARYGGEEFAIALPSATGREALELAERVRAAFEAEPLRTGGETIPVTSSFGAAEARGNGDTLESLLRDADAALYAAKRAGRNRVRAFEPTT
ncbi:histidine kinase N-terminal 7TM domain-containing protein [Paenibacillus sp.]|uniref:histidine kinase N-terminal 7TM domain-containing diguanylate cyclase n=1 Tax=Paenibacillus sp. TaxID=58172 RepID=UPI002810D6BA|nr:histidine kinase N-terminal 7TM domain-containing protein [Paenibacillus sp.]